MLSCGVKDRFGPKRVCSTLRSPRNGRRLFQKRPARKIPTNQRKSLDCMFRLCYHNTQENKGKNFMSVIAIEKQMMGMCNNRAKKRGFCDML